MAAKTTTGTVAVRIISGTYGLRDGQRIRGVRPGDDPITVPTAEGQRLVDLGIAEYVTAEPEAEVGGTPEAEPEAEATATPKGRSGRKVAAPTEPKPLGS